MFNWAQKVFLGWKPENIHTLLHVNLLPPLFSVTIFQSNIWEAYLLDCIWIYWISVSFILNGGRNCHVNIKVFYILESWLNGWSISLLIDLPLFWLYDASFPHSSSPILHLYMDTYIRHKGLIFIWVWNWDVSVNVSIKKHPKPFLRCWICSLMKQPF